MKTLLMIGGGLLFIAGLLSAVLWHYLYWYTPFTIGGFLLFEGLNHPKFSVLKKPRMFFVAWLIFILIAAMTELIGYVWLQAWTYPSFDTDQYIIQVLVIGYPFVGFFALELLVFLQNLIRPASFQFIGLPAAVLVFSYLNEIPNTFVFAWRYAGAPLGSLFGVPVHITLLWFLLLAFLPVKYFFRTR